MTTEDAKIRIRDYLLAKGVHLNNTNPPVFPCPEHDDSHPSCVLYAPGDDGKYRAWCPVCQQSWDIFELAGLYSSAHTFPEKIREVESSLNIKIDHGEKSNRKQRREPGKYVAVTTDEAKKIFSKEKLLDLAAKAGWGDAITRRDPFRNEQGLVELVDVRFEGGAGKKAVISFYYDGKYMRAKNAPILVYGREKLSEEKPRLIVEGAKCAQIAKQLTAFTSHTWNGASSKAGMADWSLFAGDPVYILPDDDQKKYKSGRIKGQLMPTEKQPGMKAALAIQKQIPHARIVVPPIKAREIKEDGADIEEILQVMTTEELTQYIVCVDNHYRPPAKPPQPPPPADPPQKEGDIPFNPLGVADDGKAYFIDRHGRLFASKLEFLTQGKLLQLASLSFWEEFFADEFKMTGQSWMKAQEWVIDVTGRKDFDVENIRGRGAWRDGDNICYHDGQFAHGDIAPGKIYLRKKRNDIGINSPDPDPEILKQMRKAIMKLSFQTPADAIRAIAWSTLAPFGGALPWRSAFLLTGESKSGKTTVADYVIRPLASPVWLRGDETTPAGVRGGLQRDSACVVFEETDDDTEYKRRSRENLFSMMRASTSDDAPDIWKGTADQGKNSYSSKNMFGFISISTQVESGADMNRLSWINMIRPENPGNWKEQKRELKELMTEKNCACIRAKTWRKLKTILSLAEDAADHILDITQMDNRFSLLEGILFAAYLVVWRDIEEMNDQAVEILKEYIRIQPPEKIENETEEMVRRILDQSVQQPGASYKDKIELREVLTAISTGVIESASDTAYDGTEQLSRQDMMRYKKMAGLYGMAITGDGYLAIRCNHHEIMKIIGRGKGYHRQLRRHPGYVETKNVSICGTTHSCIILQGVIDLAVPQVSQDEIPF